MLGTKNHAPMHVPGSSTNLRWIDGSIATFVAEDELSNSTDDRIPSTARANGGRRSPTPTTTHQGGREGRGAWNRTRAVLRCGSPSSYFPLTVQGDEKTFAGCAYVVSESENMGEHKTRHVMANYLGANGSSCFLFS